MEQKKILVTGSSGMLGKDIINILSNDKDYSVYGIDRSSDQSLPFQQNIYIDLTDFILLEKTLLKINPDVIIHCAAIVNLNECEKNKKKADELHYKVTEILSSFNPTNTKFLYISTDSVFDGEKGDYIESDIPNPLNYYAKSKYEGERVSLKRNKKTIVLRTNIYGFKISGGNSLAEWAIKKMQDGEQINGFSDVFFNPLYTKQLANLIKWLIKNDFNGTLNATSSEYISKFEFLQRLASIFGFNKNLVRSSSINDASFIVSRPTKTTLNNSKLASLKYNIPHLNDGLREFFDDYSKLYYGGKNCVQ